MAKKKSIASLFSTKTRKRKTSVSRKKKTFKVRLHDIFRVSGIDSGLKNGKGKPIKTAHDAIVVGIDRKKKTVRIKNITKLERLKKGKLTFTENKLDAVRDGLITVIPKNELGTEFLSGVYNEIHTVKISQLQPSSTKVKYPKRYKNIIG